MEYNKQLTSLASLLEGAQHMARGYLKDWEESLRQLSLSEVALCNCAKVKRELAIQIDQLEAEVCNRRAERDFACLERNDLAKRVKELEGALEEMEPFCEQDAFLYVKVQDALGRKAKP